MDTVESCEAGGYDRMVLLDRPTGQLMSNAAVGPGIR